MPLYCKQRNVREALEFLQREIAECWTTYSRKTKNARGHEAATKTAGRLAKVVQMCFFILSDDEKEALQLVQLFFHPCLIQTVITRKNNFYNPKTFVATNPKILLPIYYLYITISVTQW